MLAKSLSSSERVEDREGELAVDLPYLAEGAYRMENEG